VADHRGNTVMSGWTDWAWVFRAPLAQGFARGQRHRVFSSMKKRRRKAARSLAGKSPGQAGELPFEILATTFSKVSNGATFRFQFNFNGRDSSVKVGKELAATVAPIKNPVTGKPESRPGWTTARASYSRLRMRFGGRNAGRGPVS